MSSASFSPGSARRHHRPVMWLGVWTLLLSLLTPVVSLQAVDAANAAAERAALGEEVQCDDGQVLDEQSGECVPEGDGPPADLQQQDQGQQQDCPQGQILDPGSGQCAPLSPPECPDGSTFDPNQNECVPDQPEVQPSGVQMDKLTCPPGTDWSQASYQELDSGCPANQQPITFTHTDPQGQNTAVQVTSGYEWSPTEAGYHSITEQIPEGYGTPIVWCGSYVPQETSPTLNPTELQNGVTVGWQLQPNEWLYCKWFNIPTDGGFGKILLHKFLCPNDYDFDPTLAGIDVYQASCQEPFDGVTFDVDANENPLRQPTTDQDGYIEIAEVGVGQVSIAERLPAGYRLGGVFCSYHLDGQGNFVGQSERVDVQEGASFTWTMEAGYVLDCYLYNIPASDIFVIKHWCPAGLAFVQEPTWDDLDSACDEDGTGATFALNGPEGAEQDWQPQNPQGDPPTAGWQQVPAGDYTVTESGLDDSWTPLVYCIETPTGGFVRGAFIETPLSESGELDVTVAAGNSWYCHWFNFPNDGGFGTESENSVTVYKWECVPGTQYGQDQDYYQGEDQDVGPCESEHLNLPISLIDGNGPHDTTTQANGTEWDGVVLDQNGSFQVTVDEPAGFGDPMVFCGTLDDDAQSPVSATGGTITITPGSEPFTYQCNWYNIPDDDDDGGTGQIVIEKYFCPPDVDPSQTSTRADWQDDCQEPNPGGATFSLTGPASNEQTWPTQEATGAPPANVFWGDLPPGDYTISEGGLGDGWTSVIFCHASSGQPNGAEDSQPLSGPSIQQSLEAGFTIDCAWFNIPGDGGPITPQDESENSVTVYKWECVPGTEYGQDQDYYQGEDQDVGPCESEHLNIPISLIDGNGDHPTTTQANGTEWDGVVPTTEGTIQITVDEPDGFGDPMVFCGLLEEEKLPVPATGGTISITTGDSPFTYQCNWYNIPDDGDDGNTITVYKWECVPGTEYGQDQDYYQGEDQDVGPCESEHLNISITLVDANGQHEMQTQANGTEWENVTIGQEGELQLIEEIPDGFGDPMVFCWTGDGEPQMVPSANGFVIPTPGVQEEPWDYYCNWYNIPTGEGSNWIDFYKLWCPAGTPYDADFAGLRETCEYRDQPVELLLTHGDTTTPMTAQGQDPASWPSVPVGLWAIQETESEGYGPPIIWCQYLEWPDSAQDISGDPFPLRWSNGGASWEFQHEGLRLACAIFNIPIEENWLDITKWWCSEDIFTPYQQSADNLLEECERYTDGVDFTLEYGQQSAPQTTDGDGNAEWSGIPAGSWTVLESVPDGYADPVVWCRWMEWPDGVELTNDPYSVPTEGGSFSGEFKYGGMRLHCDVFNIPDYDPGHITVYKWVCPEGVPRDSDPDYLRQNCDYVTTGVTFNLDYGDASIPATTNSDGTAEWGDVPVGGWQLHEAPEQGYGFPVIYCQYVGWPDDADVDGEMFTPDTTDYSIRGTFEYPGLDLVCYWFNFPHDDGDSWVTIHKFYCPPNSEYPDDLEAYLEGCGDTPMDGASFELISEQYPSGSPKVTSGGLARWQGLNNGDIRIREALPEGYDPPKIWCTTYQPSDGLDAVPALDTFEMVDAPEGEWSRTIDDGPVRIVCYVFNIPNEDNTVTVHKYNCEYTPAGFNSLGEWLDACPTRGDGVAFTLDNSEGPQAQETVDGTATWTDVPLEPFTITEEPQAGYGEPVVWCGWTAYYNGAVYDGFTHLADASGGVYQSEITVPNTSYFCFWFNIPEDDSRITVYKYVCPEGVPEGVVSTELYYYIKTCTEPGDSIEFTLENSEGSSTQDIMGGSATWNDVPQGDFTLSETIPSGYGDPVWWCGFTGYENGAIADGPAQQVQPPNGVFSGSIDFDVTYYFCWVFNFPERDHNVTVHKWYCPEGTQPDDKSFDEWSSTCTEPMSNVGFTHEDSSGSTWKLTGVSGTATWYGAEPGDNALSEQHLPGYEPPVVYCELDARYDDGAAYAEGPTPYAVSDNSVTKQLDYAEFHWICHFFNIPKGPGEITIYKWYCPPGYDVNAWNADPKVDCTQAQDGIPFTLDQPVGPNLMSNTGDSMPGAVYFGDLDPGTYVVSETVPSDVGYVFVWDCVGGDIPKVHPMPLNWGSVLNVDVAGGDSITCNWYNVPDPDFGWITLYKYSCSTPTFTSEIDCQIYEFGASFELFQVDGNVSKGVGDTNAGGQFTWDTLEEGAYSLDEISHEPCKITATKVDGEGNAWVDAGQGTVIKVYNCKVDTSTTPEVPGKVPGKYPNTGVGPSGDALFPSMQQTPEPDETPIVAIDGTPTDPIEAAEQFYAISCLNEAPAAGGTPAPFVDADADEEELPPFLQEPDDAEPTAEPTAATTEGTPAAGEDCERGAVPKKLVVNAANVNHDIEVVEIVDGVMQAPTGPNVVSWYKETARLGESNNMVIAGHLNWWNVPEGPFFALDTLEEGDRIEVTGEDGNTYVYEVQWVRQESNLEPPSMDVVGPTDEQALTLITCGGEWDSAISEYNARTVARAVQVDVIPADDESEDVDSAGVRLAA